MKTILVTLSLFLPVLPGHATFTNNQTAVSVLGQPNFTSTTASANVTATTISQSEGAAVDPATGKVFIADSVANRVLRFSSANAYATGGAPESVLGQGNLTSSKANGGGNASASGINYSCLLYLDGAGRLWVTDYYNGRVLRFDNAVTKATGAAADGVLGQPDFTTIPGQNDPVTAGRLAFPAGITGDSAGRIWVTDSSRNRVLRWDNAAAKANGADPDGVLGQGNFTSSATAATATGMNVPYGISVDSAGRLWVADSENHRVLRFDSAATKPNGAAADAVLGQANFTSKTLAAPNPTSFKNPYYVTAAADGTLWVSDYGNARILAFNNASTKANGGPADLVIGQPDFVTGTANPSANGFKNPTQVAFAGPDTFFVGDYDANRVLRFGPRVSPSTTAPTLTTPATATAHKGTITLKGTSTNATSITYRIRTKRAFKTATGSAAKWTIKLTELAAGQTIKVIIRATGPDGATKQTVVTVKSLK